MVIRLPCWPKPRFQHRLGRSHSGCTGFMPSHSSESLLPFRPIPLHLPGVLRQPWCCLNIEQRKIAKQGNEQNPQTHFPTPSSPLYLPISNACPWLGQCFGCPFKGGHPWFSARFPISPCSCINSPATTPFRQIDIRVILFSMESLQAPLEDGAVSTNPSWLCPQL